MQLTPVLSAHWDEPDSFTLAGYERHDGYQALRSAITRHPDELIQLVKDSGLRGRGGAGFPTGMKWGFIPQGDGKPHYLVVNADESEPGTCKDIPLMMANPHVLVEGVVIASFAIRSNHAFIYIRGEAVHVIRRVQAAVTEAYAAGYLGKDILGTGYDLDVEPGAEDVLAEEAGRARLLHRVAQPPDHVQDLAPDVDERVAGPDRVRGDGRALDEQVRVGHHQRDVLAGPRF